MECVEGALKSSFVRPETVLKPTQQAFLDDIWTVHNNNGQNGVSVDDFFVDDLLDFSKAGEEEEKEEGTEEKMLFLSGDEPHNDNKTDFLSPRQQQQEGHVKDCSGSVPDSELCVPADDLADLEWLSHFVDDSSTGYSLTLPARKLSVNPTGNHCKPEITGSGKPIFTTPVQTKARSKRGRTGVRVWSNSLTDSSASSSSSSSYTSSSSPSPLNPWVMCNDPGQSADSLLGKAPAKKQKKKPAMDVPGGGVQPLRCSHCLVQKTPQWRSGPLGAKTLCNACGVRYKSGRLLPEYRPACSPSFSSEIHSNNHRKVLEMRRKKEGDDAFAPPVESF